MRDCETATEYVDRLLAEDGQLVGMAGEVETWKRLAVVAQHDGDRFDRLHALASAAEELATYARSIAR